MRARCRSASLRPSPRRLLHDLCVCDDRSELKRHRRDNSWVFRVPRRTQELYLEVSAAAEELSHSLGRQPTVPELAARVGVSPDNVVQALDVTSLRVESGSGSAVDPERGTVRSLAETETDAGFDGVDAR